MSGVDAAENLLAIARSRVPTGEFRVADIEELPFMDATFDLVTGFNSFQYAANPDAALAQAKRVAKSRGSVVIVTWGKPEGMQYTKLMGALKPLVPPPPPGTPGPFALSDERALRQFAMKAGLTPTEVVDVDVSFHYADLPTALRGLTSSGNAIRAAELSSDDAVRNAYAAALEQFRLISPAVPVLLATSSPDEFGTIGASGIINKTYRERELLDSVNKALHSDDKAPVVTR